MRRAIVLVLDGLRRDMLTPARTPHLAGHADQAERFEAHRSVFPSATRVVSSSVATGCYPAKHELQGNSMVLIEDGRLVAHDAGHPEFLQQTAEIRIRSVVKHNETSIDRVVFASDVDRYGVCVAACIFVGFIDGQLVSGVQMARGNKPRNS